MRAVGSRTILGKSESLNQLKGSSPPNRSDPDSSCKATDATTERKNAFLASIYII